MSSASLPFGLVKAIERHQGVAGTPEAQPETSRAVRAIKEAIRLPQTLIVLSIAIGLGLRLWTMFRNAGSLNSDMAVVGLMARHMLHGQFHAFYWGQNYGGSQEAAVAAALFALVGSSAFALKVSIALWAAASAVLVWRIGKLTVGEPAATIGALLFWVWPPEAIRLSVIQTGGHWPALAFALGALLVVLRIQHGRAEGAAWFLLLGLLAGLSVWASPEAAYVLVPAAIFFSRTLLSRWRQLPFALVGIVVGALPWLYNNINSGWASLNFPPLPMQNNGYLHRLGGFFSALLPIDLGMRNYPGRWLAPPVGQLVTIAALVAFVVAIARFRPHLRLLLVLCATFPFLYAFNRFTVGVVDGRYGLCLIPPVALLLGCAVANGRWAIAGGRAVGVTHRRAVGALGIAVAVTTIGLYPLNQTRVSSNKDLLTLLATNHVTYAYASYWIAFRTNFETGEQVVVDPSWESRYHPYDVVRNYPNAAYLFVEGEQSSVGFFAYCSRHAIPVSVHRAGAFTMAIPARQVLPEQVPVDWTS